MTATTDCQRPDCVDLRYGLHERNVFDLWRPLERATAAPLLIFIHGGGFMQGDKNKAEKIKIDRLLAAGFAVASINYRLTDAAPFPAQMHDAARALQYLRFHAADFGIDPERVACAGGSAGAGISQWLGYHADLADPTSEDPVARQSTRIQAIGALHSQCTYDPRLIRHLVPGDAHQHVAMKRLFAVGDSFDWDRDPISHATDALIRECGPLSHLDADAPPVFISHQAKNERVGDIHHPNFGRYLATRLTELGIAHERWLSTDFPDPDRNQYDALRDFLLKHLS